MRDPGGPLTVKQRLITFFFLQRGPLVAVWVGSTCPCVDGLGLGHTQVWIIPFVRLVPHSLIHSHGRPYELSLQDASGWRLGTQGSLWPWTERRAVNQLAPCLAYAVSVHLTAAVSHYRHSPVEGTARDRLTRYLHSDCCARATESLPLPGRAGENSREVVIVALGHEGRRDLQSSK